MAKFEHFRERIICLFSGLGNTIFHRFLRRFLASHFQIIPFFRIQPNLSSREKQLEAWARLIIDYCQFHNIHSLDLNEVAKSEVFNNTRINRSLNEAGIRTVFDYLEEKGKNFD